MEPKNYKLTTSDGLEFSLTEREALAAQRSLDGKSPVYIKGQRITNSDQPRFRKLRTAPISMLQLAPSVFNNEQTPRHKVLYEMATTHLPKLRAKGMNVRTSLIDYCAETTGYDAEEITKFIEMDWNNLQEHNVSAPQRHPDRSRLAPFTPDSDMGKFCGKCAKGWLPGDEGLRPCSCNYQVSELIGTV